MPHESVVVGSGPAGLAAASEASRHGVETLVLEREAIGGQLPNRHSLADCPFETEPVRGTDLRATLVSNVDDQFVDVVLEEVTAVEDGEVITVRKGADTYTAPHVVLATGSSPKPLTVPGADAFAGRGLFDCALCDGSLYRD